MKKKIVDETCVESILIRFFNNGKVQKMFLKEVKRDSEGSVIECFTKRGAKCYEKLIQTIYDLSKKFDTTDEAVEFFEKFPHLHNDEMLAFLYSLKNLSVSYQFKDMDEDLDMIVSEDY